MPIILGSLKRYRKIWGPFLLWRGIYVYYILYIICIVSYFNKNELWLYDYVLRNIGSNYNEDKRRSRLCYFQNEVPPDSFFVYIILIFNNYNDICNGN